MKPVAAIFILALSLLCSGKAQAQYNLRTHPSNPAAGAAFVAAFDGNACEVFLLTGSAQPPVVSVEGQTVRLEVDYLVLANCLAEPMSHTLSIPALPAGSYQLELVIRYFESPGSDALAESVSFQVGPDVADRRTTIPASSEVTLALLALLIAGISYRCRGAVTNRAQR